MWNTVIEIKLYILEIGLVPPNWVGVTLLPRLRMGTDVAQHCVLFLTWDDGKVHNLRETILYTLYCPHTFLSSWTSESPSFKKQIFSDWMKWTFCEKWNRNTHQVMYRIKPNAGSFTLFWIPPLTFYSTYNLQYKPEEY